MTPVWAAFAVAVVTLTTLGVLADLVTSALWVAFSLLASLATYYIGGAVVLSRWHRDEHHANVPPDKLERYERMRRAHAAQVAGIARTSGDRDAAAMEELLACIELRWTGLSIEHAELVHEEGRLRADHPWTEEQRQTIGRMAERRHLVAQHADQLERIGRRLPGRVAVLAGVSYQGGMSREGLQLAMLEAQLQVDSIVD
jgi:hypothetical protein